MKNIKTKLLSVSAAALVTSSFASAAVQQLNNTWYAITYSAVFEESIYTASKPLVNGTPDPNHVLGPGGSPVLASLNPPVYPSPITGTGFLNLNTGEIRLDPIQVEVSVAGGSYGYVNWSQTLHGSFSSNVFSMTTQATVNSGSVVCETVGSNACNGVGGVGATPKVLLPPQTYAPAETDDDGFVITPEQPLVHVNAINFSAPIATGVTGRYLYQGNVSPAYEDTTIDIAVGNVVFVPVPAAAWLFAPSLIALGAGKRFRSKQK